MSSAYVTGLLLMDADARAFAMMIGAYAEIII
jgi:hypothetical protein